MRLYSCAMWDLHDDAAAASRAGFQALAITGVALAGFLVVDEVLGFHSHVDYVRGGSEGEFAV